MNATPTSGHVRSALATGAGVVVRPIRQDDEAMMVRFHEGLSDRSVYLRYFHMMTLAHRTDHARLLRVCDGGDERSLALVAEGRDEVTGGPVIMGVARLQHGREGSEAEFAVVVADRYQRIGVGEALLRRLVALAREARVSRLRADILSENGPMRRLCGRVGIPVRPTPDPQVVVADLRL